MLVILNKTKVNKLKKKKWYKVRVNDVLCLYPTGTKKSYVGLVLTDYNKQHKKYQ